MMSVIPDLDETFAFLTQTLLKNFTFYLFDQNQKLSKEWEIHNMQIGSLCADKECIPAYVMDSDVKDLWSLIYNTGDSLDMSLSILSSKKYLHLEEESQMEADSQISKERATVFNQLIIKFQGPISGFAVNPINSKQIS
jgi:hypothetical protein